LGQAGEICSQSQTEVTYLGGAIGTQPDIAGFYVAMDNAFGVGKLEAPADSLGHTHCLPDGQAMLWGFLNQALDIATGHDRDNDVRLSFMIPNIVDSNDVRVIAESPHSPGFADDAGSAGIIQFLSLDEGKGHITVE
jgi:hypothetical protein